MLKVGLYFRKVLKEIVLYGDYADFYSVMTHDKSPDLDRLLVQEVEAVNKRLDELDKLFPKANKVYLEGNHEDRLERYLCNQAPALFGITDIRFLFKLNQRPRWKLIPYGPNQQYKVLGSKLLAKHEPPPGSVYNSAKEAGSSIVFGHVHRKIESFHVNLKGKEYGGYCPGWLGDKKKKTFDYVKKHHQWQLGFDLIWVDKKTKLYYRQNVHILENYTCVVDGKLFK